MRGAFLDDIRNHSEEYPFPLWKQIIDLACSYDDGLDYKKENIADNNGFVWDGEAGDDLLWSEEYDDRDFSPSRCDFAPSRLIQYTWPQRTHNNDSVYYCDDVNYNWLDTFEIKQFGPFDDRKFLETLLKGSEDAAKVGKSNIARTLLVNDVDRYFPKLSHWMDCRFNNNNCFGANKKNDERGSVLPARWRRDDAQISLSYPAGGIGPHVDDYDVFLIQLSGERTW